jgi:head-tail adaptor
MAVCVRVKRKKTKVCAGSLNRTIEIHSRAIATPTNILGAGVDYGESFTFLYKRRSMVAPIKGQVIFDGVVTEKIPTHNFFIRYTPGITAENWIVFDGGRYDIINVLNIDQNSNFLQLEARLRGDSSKQATYA